MSEPMTAPGETVLRGCPFCGGEAELRKMAPYPNQAPNRWFVVCPLCDVTPDVAWDKSKAEAIAAWNTRASDKLVEQLREAAQRVLEWWPENGEAQERFKAIYGSGFGDDIRALRQALAAVRPTPPMESE